MILFFSSKKIKKSPVVVNNLSSGGIVLSELKNDDIMNIVNFLIRTKQEKEMSLKTYQTKAYEEYDLQKRRIIPELSHPAGGRNSKEIEPLFVPV